MPDFAMAEKPVPTKAQRCADAVTEFSGSWTFIFVFLGLIVAWLALNLGLLIGVFDPYPYIFLNLVLTVVSTFQGPLILMSQNRQTDRDREALHAILAAVQDVRLGVARPLVSSRNLVVTQRGLVPMGECTREELIVALERSI